MLLSIYSDRVLNEIAFGIEEFRKVLQGSEMNGVRATSFACQIATFSALVGYPAPSAADAAPWFEPEAICRTAIASIMGRDPKIVQVTRVAGDILFLSYVRPIDNFVWDYRCKIQGNRVVWASEPGRWREDPKDDKVFFEIVGDGRQLRIIEDHGDGSTTKELFERHQIQ